MAATSSSSSSSLALAAGLGAAAGALALAYARRPRAPYDGSLDEVSALVRPNIRRLEPYRCARDDYEEGVLLDANENAFGPVVQTCPGGGGRGAVVRAACGLDLHRYPCPYQKPLKDAVGAFRGVNRDNIFVGVGSDEAIDLLFRVFCEPRRANVVTLPATYGMYKVCAAAQDVAVRTAPLTPETFMVDIAAVEAAVDADTRLVFVCSPGNPTCKSIPAKDVRALLESPKLARCIVVLDEAYVDYSDEPSLAPLVHDYPRLVVLHTLSKAFGLAGVRCGTAISSPKLVQYLNNIKAPYSINKMTSVVATAAFSDAALTALRANVADTKAQRSRLAAALGAKPYVAKVFDSDANFLLVRFKDHAKAKPLYTALAEAGVVIRYRGDQKNLGGCVRVTVGTPADNDALLALLDKTAPDFGLL